MESAFDIMANNYDDDFTNSIIGLKQRRRVWDYFNEKFDTNNRLSILELNCGTGEDAIYMAKRGHDVIATDQSQEMLEVAKTKASEHELKGTLMFLQYDINQPMDDFGNLEFDLIFSNFGGLNCVTGASLIKLNRKCYNWLKPNGSLLFIIMPKNCLLDMLFNMLKFDFRKIRNRRKGMAMVNLKGKDIASYYYNYKEIRSRFSNFNLHKVSLVGLIPSYLNKYMHNHPRIFELISSFEQKIRYKLSWVNRSDHYLIHLKNEG